MDEKEVEEEGGGRRRSNIKQLAAWNLSHIARDLHIHLFFLKTRCVLRKQQHWI